MVGHDHGANRSGIRLFEYMICLGVNECIRRMGHFADINNGMNKSNALERCDQAIIRGFDGRIEVAGVLLLPCTATTSITSDSPCRPEQQHVASFPHQAARFLGKLLGQVLFGVIPALGFYIFMDEDKKMDHANVNKKS